MKFNDIPYTRPAIEAYENTMNELLSSFNAAEHFEAQEQLFLEIYQSMDDFSTMYQLAGIKYQTDTSNKSYQEENEYFSEVLPINEKLTTEFYKAILDAKFKTELIGKYGQHLFDMAALNIKGFDPVIIEELKELNKLANEYTKVKGTAEIDFKGEKLNLPGIGKYLVDADRSVRQEADTARWGFFASKQKELDKLYDDMVKLRHQMAQKMGYEKFTDLGYVLMGRIDYNRDMVRSFREQIVKHIVPIATKLRERQRRRLGYDQLMSWDLNFNFVSGNPKPKGTPEEILQKGRKMYKELSEETHQFFEHMLKYDLLDVINRPGKADAGFCWELSNYKHPFIFANFNGTSGDIDVLTHEAGHAFQYFSSNNTPVIDYRWPTSEACEIHSMSMEFLCYPWMEMFFEEDAEKYFFSHMNNSILFLPYGCAVDHFQHIIYENPEMTPDERAKAWKEMEDLYLPDRNESGIEYLDNGRFWQKQGHIYEMPFYYIDYVLAQICAFQFWQKNQKDSKKAWEDYLRLCKEGGKQPFLKLVELADLKSPFEDGVLKSVAEDIERHLDQIDDTKF